MTCMNTVMANNRQADEDRAERRADACDDERQFRIHAIKEARNRCRCGCRQCQNANNV